jgi:alkylated DNA repair dioxygenase AlkB
LGQLDLFAKAAPSIDREYRGLVRTELAHGAWIDRVPGWVSNDAALFAELERDLPWRDERMFIARRWVDVPRLLARLPAHTLIDQMRDALSLRYGEAFVHVTAALYRNGRDSVAMHGDTTARDMDQAIVATVSLGAPRKLLVKPTDGGHSIGFELGRGDLFVMGGTCQRTWRHGIPKVASAHPRIAVMFRPAWGASYDE